MKLVCLGEETILCSVTNNKEASLRRLNSLNKRQEIIQDQNKAGVVERAEEPNLR